MNQHRPRIDADIASVACANATAEGRRIMKAMRDLNPKLDKWKIKGHFDSLAALETTFNKFRPFTTDLAETPYIRTISTDR